MTFDVKCPKCGYSQFCPCDVCRDKLPEGIKPWIWVPKDEMDGRDGYIRCANCGFTAHEDFWLEEEGRQRWKNHE